MKEELVKLLKEAKDFIQRTQAGLKNGGGTYFIAATEAIDGVLVRIDQLSMESAALAFPRRKIDSIRGTIQNVLDAGMMPSLEREQLRAARNLCLELLAPVQPSCARDYGCRDHRSEPNVNIIVAYENVKLAMDEVLRCANINNIRNLQAAYKRFLEVE